MGCSGSLEMLWERNEPAQGCFSSLGSQRRGSRRQDQGVRLGQAAAAHCSPGCKSCGVPESLGDV